MSTQVAVRGATAVIAKPEFREEVAKALVGETIGVDKFLRVARTAFLTNPKLEQAEPSSVVLAVLQAASFGLLPDGRQAAFVPFKGKCQFLPMVAGLRQKAAEHGVQIAAWCVFANDDFDYQLGTNPDIRHKPVRLGEDPGELIGAYAIATDRDGLKYVDVMARQDIEKIRRRSRAADDGPWVTDFEEMAKKTVVKRVFKQVPLLVQAQPGLFAEPDYDADPDEGGERTLSAPAMTVDADAAFDDGDVYDGEAEDVTDTPAGNPADSPTVEAGAGRQADDRDNMEGVPVAAPDDADWSPADMAEQAQARRRSRGTS